MGWLAKNIFREAGVVNVSRKGGEYYEHWLKMGEGSRLPHLSKHYKQVYKN